MIRPRCSGPGGEGADRPDRGEADRGGVEHRLPGSILQRQREHHRTDHGERGRDELAAAQVAGALPVVTRHHLDQGAMQPVAHQAPSGRSS